MLEPGCGKRPFHEPGASTMRFIGIELDSLSGRIARALHPGQDIRIENFRDTRLPEGRIDAPSSATSPLPTSGLTTAVSVSPARFLPGQIADALKPGGVLR